MFLRLTASPGRITWSPGAVGLPNVNIPLINNSPDQNNLIVKAGDAQHAKILTPFDLSLQIQAQDRTQKPVSLTNVIFLVQNAAGQPGGTFSNNSSSITVTTDINGLASANLKANQYTGPFQVQVSSDRL